MGCEGECCVVILCITFLLVLRIAVRLALHTLAHIAILLPLSYGWRKERDMALWLKEQTYCMKHLAVTLQCANFEGYGLTKNNDRDWRIK